MRCFLLGSCVPSAFVLWIMRELPPPIKVHKQEQSTAVAFISYGAASPQQPQRWATATNSKNQVSLLPYCFFWTIIIYLSCSQTWPSGCVSVAENVLEFLNLFFFFLLFPTSKDSQESSVYIRCSILRYLMRIYNFHVLILEFSLIVLFLMPMSFSFNDTSSLCRKVEGSSLTGCVYN